MARVLATLAGLIPFPFGFPLRPHCLSAFFFFRFFFVEN
jgi:hypothetical protein